MIQDLGGVVVPSFRHTKSWTNNLIGSALAVSAWGYFLYQGVTDPLGGINTLWPLFGISNQMLAAIALMLCTVVLFKMKRQKYAWVTIVPCTWLMICTLTAGLQKIFSGNTSIGFISHAAKFSDAIAANKIIGPAKSMADMNRIVSNDYVDATLTSLFVMVVGAILVYGLIDIRKALMDPKRSMIETGPLGVLAGGSDD
jgi:carbon starvation protein